MTGRRSLSVLALGVVSALGVAGLAGGERGARSQFPPNAPVVPLGLVAVPWPKDNPYSAAKAELGWLLYYDKRLSSDGTVACASCHDPKFAFTDGKAVSTGIGGQTGGRSAPTVINRAYSLAQFWDGRAPTLEEQAKGPIANSIEMTSAKEAQEAHAQCVERLRKIAQYRLRFLDVFGTEQFTIDHVAKAIATFERTVLSGNSPYDRHINGDEKALTPAQKRGMELFFGNKTKCTACHEGISFTNGMFANVGIGMDKPAPDLGRFKITGREEEKGAFKTPTLREIANTAPYMHDGRFKTLEEVVDHYNKGGIKNPWLHQDIKPLDLTPPEKEDLVEFLKALSGEGWQHLKPPAELPK